MKDQVLKVLARCRILEQSVMESKMSIEAIVADQLVEEKLVFKETVKEGFYLRRFYTLTDKGEAYVKKNVPGIKELYRGFVQEQDLELCRFYLDRSQEEQNSWITRDDLIKQYKLPGTVDGAFLNKDGELVGVKTISKTADFSAVERVETFLKATEIPHILYVIF